MLGRQPPSNSKARLKEFSLTTPHNTTGTTQTLLVKTCTNNNTWVKVSASLTASHSYSLTLVSHDDNYPGDPTYTCFDDVAVQ
jgi:hypothetical protein